MAEQQPASRGGNDQKKYKTEEFPISTGPRMARKEIPLFFVNANLCFVVPVSWNVRLFSDLLLPS